MTTLFILTTCIILLVLFSLWAAAALYIRATNMAPYYAEKANLVEEIAAAKKTLSETRNEINDLRAEIARAKDTIAEATGKKAWLDANQGTIAALQVQINQTQAQLNNVTSNYQNAVADLQNKNQQLQDLLIRLDAEKRELARVQGDISSLENRKKELESAIKTADATIINRRAKLEQLDSQIASKNVKIDSLEEKIKQEEKRLSDITNDIEKKLKEKSDIESSIAKQKEDMEQRRTAFEDEIARRRTAFEKDIAQQKTALEAEIAKLNEEIANLNKKKAELTFTIKGLEGTTESTKKKWEDLERPIEPIKGRKPNKQREEEWIEEFEDTLRAHHFIFNPRMIRAFHTSLKVADCSPMVVLAGISGTGKSLLPELYARAIGMNFLQIPVQPRWDSPQDLLGFYNYMEGRFKATELSRLLWQTDTLNNTDVAKQNPGMNLILLDEMNLARVEYYFSDLLSKLEVRRGIDTSTPEKRKAAEIVLEGGAFGTDNIRRIFVGHHNLFIGTMNEDESTQTLSDKVKDRANVLRFGRPKTLSGVPTDKEGFLKQIGDRLMTYTQWGSWMKTPADSGVQDLDKKLDTINNHLATLGRPFAHRMRNAIRAYISQYPGNKKDALIDQIEMKILPKLAGLDMAETAIHTEMDKLQNVIGELEDDALTAAFGQAMSREFFTWRGIDR